MSENHKIKWQVQGTPGWVVSCDRALALTLPFEGVGLAWNESTRIARCANGDRAVKSRRAQQEADQKIAALEQKQNAGRRGHHRACKAIWAS